VASLKRIRLENQEDGGKDDQSKTLKINKINLKMHYKTNF